MSRSKAGSSPESLFDTSEGEAPLERSAGTEVLGGLVPEEAVLIVESGRHAGERVILGAGTCVIGRSSKCALVLRRSAGVSRRHSKITYVGGTYELSDCGSRNGTRVNGQAVAEGFPLNDGDLIEVSDERIRYRGPSGREPNETRGLLLDARALERLPSREPLAGEVLKTQHAHVEPPDSQLLTMDGGSTPGSPVPPRANPRIPAVKGPTSPAAPTALFTAEVDALRARKPPPPPTLILPPRTLPVEPSREPPKGVLLAIGALLGVVVLVGGVVGWDLLGNDGRLTSALAEDLGLSSADASEERPQAALPTAPSNEEPKGAAPSGGDVDESASIAPRADAPLAPDAETADAEAVGAKAAGAETVARANARQADEPRGAAANASASVVDVRADTAGRVRSLAVSQGDTVRAGDVLVVLERAPAGSTARKLQALRREEADFARAAAQGDARARADLAGVRREIARLERRGGVSEVKASVDGRVERVLVAPGKRVNAGDALVRVVPAGP